MYYREEVCVDRGPRFAVTNNETDESVGFFWNSEDADEVCMFYNEQEKNGPKTTTVFREWIERQCGGTQNWDHPESVLDNFMYCTGASSLDILSIFGVMFSYDDPGLELEHTQKLREVLRTNPKYHFKLSNSQ